MEIETPTTISPTMHDTELARDRLEEVIGGLEFIFRLVAVKTVSWAHDD
jgi:hypothetical protein